MKNFVVKSGGFIVNVIALVTLIGLIISTVKVMINQGFMAGIAVLWAGIVSFVFVFFMIYLAISINDHLANIDERYNCEEYKQNRY